VITLEFGPEDLLRCRFAISPLWEVGNAARAVLDGYALRAQLPWLRAAGERMEGLDLAPLRAVLVHTGGYTPDFLSPPPSGPLQTIEEGLARVRATPLERVRHELAMAADGAPHDPLHAVLLADPEAARALLADLLEAAWDRLVAPHWPQLRDVLEGDLVERARQLSAGGMERLLADLHPDVAWRGGRIEVDKPADEHRRLDGEGLVLMPSVFTHWGPLVLLDPPWQPTIAYPARGTAQLWLRAGSDGGGGALAALLGRTRALLLTELAEPATTTRLAARHRLAPATVSEHLRVLLGNGLLTAHRSGREVRYALSPIGHALLCTTPGFATTR
jgi:DNA-binding transcriptional ArsR family regulator